MQNTELEMKQLENSPCLQRVCYLGRDAKQTHMKDNSEYIQAKY